MENDAKGTYGMGLRKDDHDRRYHLLIGTARLSVNFPNGLDSESHRRMTDGREAAKW